MGGWLTHILFRGVEMTHVETTKDLTTEDNYWLMVINGFQMFLCDHF